MTQTAVSLVERRFLKFRDSLTLKEWESPERLKALALETEPNDVALARRIMQRARNLAPENEAISQQLQRLNEKTQDLVPISGRSSSENERENLALVDERPVVPAATTRAALFRATWFRFLLLPIALFAFYQLLWASPRYESRAQLIVQQPDMLATMDTSLALLSGFGVASAVTSDAQLVSAYIHSEDMLAFLESELSLREHYSESGADLFSRLHSWSSKEDFLTFYQQRVAVEVDDKSGVIVLKAQAFEPEYSAQLTRTIVGRAEWYINSLGHQLAESQLDFIKGEHQLVETRLESAKQRLLLFQQQHNLLDPEAEGIAFQQITYGLEAELASKRAELAALLSIMSADAPQVLVMQSAVRALETQLDIERERLSLQGTEQSDSDRGRVPGQSISEVLARYTSLKVELELALQAFTASEVSLEKSRVEAYRQLKYLMIVESPTRPEESQYPEAAYNIALFSVLLLMLFGIVKIVIATAKELS
ncbi:lipopolysaccharide biosynthesis protein [Marinobacter hydrocarbonoclasticus]|nr:lipopolysaccharide biosynthesis protein [Marinobacter nauticus]